MSQQNELEFELILEHSVLVRLEGLGLQGLGFRGCCRVQGLMPALSLELPLQVFVMGLLVCFRASWVQDCL